MKMSSQFSRHPVARLRAHLLGVSLCLVTLLSAIGCVVLSSQYPFGSAESEGFFLFGLFSVVAYAALAGALVLHSCPNCGKRFASRSSFFWAIVVPVAPLRIRCVHCGASAVGARSGA
jgi:hypothetical protein